VLDRRVDLYGLGVVLYELLTLNMPYEALSDASLVRKVLYDPYLPPAERRPELPLALQQVLARLLAKNRDERYEDCRALQADLERYIHATGETASGYALAQLITRLVPVVPVGTPLTEPELPIFTPTALGAAATPSVFPVDAPGVDGEAKTAVASRLRRAAPEGFVFPGALESERSPVRTARPLGVDFDNTDLHGATEETDPLRDSPRRSSRWPFVAVLLCLGLVAVAGWLYWNRAMTPTAQPSAPAAPVLPSQAPPPAPPPPEAVAKPAPPIPSPAAPVVAPPETAREAALKLPTPPAGPAPAPAAKRERTVPSKLLGAFEAAEAQAPKAAEEAPEATMRFESKPPLRVRVGDHIVGTTPVVVRFPATGPADVELFDTGLGLTRVEHVEVVAGDNGVRTVTFEKGAIDFQVQPGIVVYVDGKKLGEAPFEKPVSLYEGKHPVRLVLGEQEERRLVTVAPGETETLEFSFER
jgi:hypothetical protein